MNDALFSLRGRLTRRDYALTIGALSGGMSLLSFAALSALLPLSYVVAMMFFRETAVTFWILLVVGITLILTAAAVLVPLLAIPATVRRLHDMGCGGWLACPLIPMSILPLGLPILCLFLLAALLEGLTRTSEMIFFDSPEELGLILGGFVISYLILCFAALLLLSAYGAWLFLKKGMPMPNRYGDVPAEEEIPSVHAAFFAATGQIDRAHFIFRALIVLAVAGILVPTLGQSVLYPTAAIGKSLGITPIGTDFFVLLIGSTIYPLTTLPLVLRRLRTLGRSAWEAGIVYAALLPNIICTAQIARLLGCLDLVSDAEADDAIADAIMEDFIQICTEGDAAFIALWTVCAALSLVGVMRLLHANNSD